MLLFNPDRPTPRASYQAVKSMEPLSRNADPVGSFQAAERTRKTGLGSRKRLAVYHALRRYQGTTSAELAKAAGLDRYDVARRLPELERAGWIVRGRRRRCAVTGCDCVTWYVTRRWIDATDGTRRAVPCERPTEAATARTEPRSSSTQGPGPAPVPDDVLTTAERRALRERLAAEGDERTKNFLRGLR
jgi:hypothetical protein